MSFSFRCGRLRLVLDPAEPFVADGLPDDAVRGIPVGFPIV
ncbi:hypothetical protein [Nocardia sp. Marseille-Q1738]